MDFKKWTDIEGLHNVVKHFRIPLDVFSYRVRWIPKIKIDGTNAGIRISRDGTVKACKRTSFITPEEDNFGFAKWVETNKGFFSNIAKKFDPTTDHLIIWGEWAGPGIANGYPLQNHAHKVFCVFAFEYYDAVGNMLAFRQDWGQFRYYFGSDNWPLGLDFVAFDNKEFTADLCQRETIQTMADEINKYIADISECDPWVKARYGYEGPGEGAVLYPTCVWINDEKPDVFSIDTLRRLMFKAKGEAHRVNKTKEAVIIDPEVVKSRGAFVDKFVTPARLNQGLQNVPVDIKNMGAFLKWVGNDVLKESKDELEVSGIEWKDVAKGVNQAASAFFKKQCMTFA